MRPIKYKTEEERVAAKREATRLRNQRYRQRLTAQARGAESSPRVTPTSGPGNFLDDDIKVVFPALETEGG